MYMYMYVSVLTEHSRSIKSWNNVLLLGCIALRECYITCVSGKRHIRKFYVPGGGGCLTAL